MDELSHAHTTWLNFTHGLTVVEKQQLAEKYGLSLSHLETSTHGKTPRAKVAANRSYVYFVFHIPYKTGESKKYSICELNVFVTKSTLTTIQSQGSLKVVNDYFSATQTSAKLKDKRCQDGPVSLFYKLFLHILQYLDEVIDAQGEAIDQSDREIFKKPLARHFIEKISVLRYNQTIINTAIQSQLQILSPLKGRDNPLLNLSPKSKDNWSKIIDSFSNINHQVVGDSHHLEGLIRTFESLITFRTNEIIKILTVFSVTLLPLNVISGIYGMNFHNIPFATNPLGFFITVGYMFTVAFTLALVFRFKRWL